MNSNTNAWPKTEPGFALVSVMLVMIVMAAMSAALVSTSIYRKNSSLLRHDQERAYEKSMAGLDVAIFEIQEGTDTGSDGIGNASASFAGGGFTVKVSPAFAGSGKYTVTSSGRQGRAKQAVEVNVAQDSAPFGLFGRDLITMSGSFYVDSYKSSAGTYASQFGVDHAGSDANVMSNGDINAGGGPVWGDAIPGPGHSVGSPGNVTGSTAPATAPVVMPPYVYAPAIAASGSWSGPGTISAGTYRYTQLTLNGSSVLTINGAVTLYVDDKFVASGGSSIVLSSGASLTIHHGANDFKVSGGGLINTDQKPSTFKVYSASVKKFELSGGSNFFGLVYAPEAQFVSSGGSQLFGAIIAKTATLSGGGSLHIDNDLGGGGSGSGFTIKSIRKVKAF